MRLADLAAADCADAAALMRESYADAFGDSMAAADLEGVMDGLSEAHFTAMRMTDRLIGAWLGDALAGFVQIGPASPALRRFTNFNDDGDAMELRRLYVRPLFQGKGVGHTLIAAAMDHAGAKPVLLDVWIRNARALALYRRCGFDVIGEIYPVFASGPAPEPDLVMLRAGVT